MSVARLSGIDDKKMIIEHHEQAVTCRARLFRWLPAWSSRATLGPLGAEPTFILAQSTMRRRQLLHNPGKFISARPSALLPLRIHRIGSIPYDDDTLLDARVSSPWYGVWSPTCVHLREICGGTTRRHQRGVTRVHLYIRVQLRSDLEIFLLGRNDSSSTVHTACSFRLYVMTYMRRPPCATCRLELENSATSPFRLPPAARYDLTELSLEGERKKG